MRRGARILLQSVPFVAIVTVFCWHVAAAPPAPIAAPNEAAARSVAAESASMEAAWRVNTANRFAGDRWSADDDFHNSERHHMEASAQARGLAPASILRAIDDGLHAHPAAPWNPTMTSESVPRRANASPCKPRAFYE